MTTPPEDPAASKKCVRQIPVGLIDPDPVHPRADHNPEALARLAESLSKHGQIQPVIVRTGPHPGRFTIVVGARRWRASALAGLPTVDAVVLDASPDRGRSMELQLVENLVREGLNPIDQANAFRVLMDRQNWSGNRLAAELHLSQSTVSRTLGLLALPEPVRLRVADGSLSVSAAYEIAKIDDPGRQVALAERAGSEGLNRDEVRREAKTPPPLETPTADHAHRVVFHTTLGRVTVELEPPGGDNHDIIDAVLQVAEYLQGLRDGPATEDGDPPGRTPGVMHGA